VRIADSEAATESALSDAPAAVVVDLHAASIDTADVIRRASGAGARVLAFGRHTEPATLRAARDAGAETVVPRSQLVEELPALLGRLLASRKARA
jgi:DNA-binding NarL/FixJ family response regulator